MKLELGFTTAPLIDQVISIVGVSLLDELRVILALLVMKMLLMVVAAD
jgi:hypothetical protein